MINFSNPSSSPTPSNTAPASPSQLNQWLNAGMEHHRAGRLQDAERIYRQILAHQPNHADTVHLMGVLACQVNNFPAAIDLIRRAITLNPSVPSYHSNLGEALRQSGMLPDAEASLRRALQLNPQFPDALTNLSIVLMQTGRAEEAVAAARQVVTLAPSNAGLRQTLADMLVQARRPEEALAEYNAALQLNPNLTAARFNAAILLSDLGRVDEARDLLAALVAANPNDLEARMQLAEMLARRGMLTEALAQLDEVVARDPSRPEAYAKMGNVFRSGDRPDLAIDAYQKAVQLKPQDAVAAANMALALRDQARLSESITILRGLVERDPDASAIRSALIFTMHLDPTISRDQIEREQQRWNDAYMPQLAPERLPHANDPSPDRRIRVAYISPDFRSHPVGRFMVPLIRNHDRSQVEVCCYSIVHSPDAYTEAIAKAADQWRHIPTASFHEMARIIRNDQIDILVDLTNHTIDNRMPVFAMKPAPVQITYLAYCAGTGLRTIDYRLTDPFIDPPGNNENTPFEKPLRLAETYWCYYPHEDAQEISPLPMLTRGHVTFGSFNYFSKCNDHLLDFWARLLREIPDSHFHLHVPTGNRVDYVRNFFTTRGIAPERLQLVPRTREDVYFKRYQDVDIALDTFPWAGGTTTCDALWMGVPVISLAQENTISRGGLSILSNLGLQEWVARTHDDYIAKAKAFSTDVLRLQKLRGTLRERMRHSVVMDAPRFARHVEQAYRLAWQNWCNDAGRA